MRRTFRSNKGFTLIEVIITIVVAALMGVMVFTYMGTTLTRSAEPLLMVRDLAESIEIMEQFTSDYSEYLKRTIEWADFTATLTGTGVSAVNRQGQSGTDFENADFPVWEVTVTRNNQTISALFSR